MQADTFQWQFFWGRKEHAPPPYGLKFSQFHAVFRKIWQFRMFGGPLDVWQTLIEFILILSKIISLICTLVPF